ncbi:MAG: hypothetical protein ABFD07_02915 [Methanobacterium sp.]
MTANEPSTNPFLDPIDPDLPMLSSLRLTQIDPNCEGDDYE